MDLLQSQTCLSTWTLLYVSGAENELQIVSHRCGIPNRREGAEWLHNRRILHRLLLNGNLNWMDVHIENCTRNLCDRWQAEAEQSNKDMYELPKLEHQLYRWSIEGRKKESVNDSID